MFLSALSLCRSSRRIAPANRRRGGFALIVTLSLMTMLLLLVLVITTLVRLNLATSNTSLYTALARQNALLGAYIGVGQLQKFAGPDQRVTSAADLGRVTDVNDKTTTIPTPGFYIPDGAPSIGVTPAPYGRNSAYSLGGTRYWTAVWGHGTNPLTLYSSQPQPVLLTWLVSGNENAPIYLNTTTPSQIGQIQNTGDGVQVPAVPTRPSLSSRYLPFGADTQTISSQLVPQPTLWSTQTYDLKIASNTGNLTPAVVLAGVNSVGNSTVSIPTLPPAGTIATFNENVNYIIVPLVNVLAPSDSASAGLTSTTGRYGFWVRDEGLKAKYTPVDPYAGNVLTSTTTGQTGQVARYRYMAAPRSGMERMTGFGTSFANSASNPTPGFSTVNNPFTYNGTSTPLLNRMLESQQIVLIDGNLTQANPSKPTAYLQQHFHDLTTYSYGVLSDTLRGGLRFDLTSAFEPGASGTSPANVFGNATLGLAGKSFLPTSVGSTTNNSEPNSPVAGPLQSVKWDLLKSYYNIAATIAAGNDGLPNAKITTPVTMQVGSSTQMAISPIILQARIQFSAFSNFNLQTGVAVQTAYVLANPYNFPIRAPAGGLDIGWRISTNTQHDWGLSIAARGKGTNPRRVIMVFDNTTDPLWIARYEGNSGFLGGKPGNGSNNYGYGLQNGAGYFPVLNNLLQFPGTINKPSVLDNVGFHISQADSLLQPGEAKAYSLGPYPASNLVIPAGWAFGDGGAVRTISRTPGSYLPLTTGAARPKDGYKIVPGAQISMYVAGPNDALTSSSTASVLQVPLSPGFRAFTYFVREAGSKTDQGTATTSILGANWGPMDTTTYASDGPYPDPAFGWFVDLFPSVAATIELRLDASTSTASAPGTNVLTSLVNVDLTGSGLPGAYNSGVPFINPSQPSGWRRAYGDLLNGMPSFIGGFYTMLVPPVSYTYIWQPNNGLGSSDSTFTPSNALSFRNFADYNLRAINMAVPPFAQFNSLPANNSSGGTLLTTNGFIAPPPYGRFFDQGGYDYAGDNPPSGAYVPGSNFGQNLGTPSGYGNATVPWGYTDTASDGYDHKFTVLYNLPLRLRNQQQLLTYTPPGNSTAMQIPDVPILNIAQLTNADVTADDVWISVGYQPANAIGNSYASPYVLRNQSIQNRTNSSGLLTPAQSSNATIRATGSTTTNIHSFDMSYLMNIALWDRYFFSGLYWPAAGGGSANALAAASANSRLKYAVTWPTNTQLGAGNANAMVTDPVTGLQMFKAYAAARYMMIDGAFNINSTSVEAWKAVLSSLRNVQYNGNTTPVTTQGSTSFSRVLASGSMTTTSGGSQTYSVAMSPTSSGSGVDTTSFAGFRQLSDYEIDMLAVKIVQQIRIRGPFLSLAQFINRTLTSTNGGQSDARGYSGPLQTAIDLAVPNIGTSILGPGLNNFTTARSDLGSSGSSASASWMPGNTTFFPNGSFIAGTSAMTNLPGQSSSPISKVAGIPTWLMQSDILQAIGSILAARSDTFVVRSYGDVINPNADQSNIAQAIVNDPTLVQSRAWCELVVQRYPDYIDPSNDPTATAASVAGSPTFLNPSTTSLQRGTGSFVNGTFGRRFRIVSLRWLNPSDI